MHLCDSLEIQLQSVFALYCFFAVDLSVFIDLSVLLSGSEVGEVVGGFEFFVFLFEHFDLSLASESEEVGFERDEKDFFFIKGFESVRISCFWLIRIEHRPFMNLIRDNRGGLFHLQ